MRIPKAVLGGFLILVLIAAGVYFFVLDKSPAKPEDRGETAAAAPSGSAAAPAPEQKVEAAPLPVKVDKAVIGDLVMTLKSPGAAYTEKRVDMKAEVGGVVKNLYATEGRHVREGDLLVELDDREYRLNLERLEAQRLRFLSELFLERQFSVTEEPPSRAVVDKVAKAQADYDRVAQGFKSGVASQSDLEKAQAALELTLIEAGSKKDEVQAATKGLTQAEVDVKIARLNLDKTRIRAPFAGIVTVRHREPGEIVAPGSPVLAVLNRDDRWVRIYVPETRIGAVRPGQGATITADTYRGKEYGGEVVFIASEAEFTPKNVQTNEERVRLVYAVKVRVTGDPGYELKPGLPADVELLADRPR